MASQTPLGREVLHMPFGEIIREVALGIAEAQFELDKSSMAVAELMGGQRVLREAETSEPILKDGKPQIIDSRVFFGHNYQTLGQDAKATATLDSGTIAAIEVEEGGTGYFEPPTIKLSGGGGSGAVATAVVEEGKITDIVVDQRGTGYTAAPIVEIIPEIKVESRKASMMELGFVPNFYQFVDTVIEMRLALRINKRSGNRYTVSAATVDANYASAFNYNLNLATTVKTKIVPIPPPTILEDRVRALVAEGNTLDELKKSGNIETVENPA